MALRNRQGTRSRTTWLTAAFWILTLVFTYALLGLFGWWVWLVYLGAGFALTCFWWTRRRHSRYAIVFGSTCTVSVVMALAMIGWALCATVSVPVDSVGPPDSGVRIRPQSGADRRTESHDRRGGGRARGGAPARRAGAQVLEQARRSRRSSSRSGLDGSVCRRAGRRALRFPENSFDRLMLRTSGPRTRVVSAAVLRRALAACPCTFAGTEVR